MNDNHHISKTDYIAFQQDCMNRAEKEKFLEHISTCDYCSDQFAAFMSEEIIPAPRDMKENILKASKRLDNQLAAKANETSKRIQLFIYSLKVGTATIGALLLLLLTMNYSNMHSNLDVPHDTSSEISFEGKEKTTITGSIRSGLDNISKSMLDFTNSIMKTEVTDYDQEEK